MLLSEYRPVAIGADLEGTGRVWKSSTSCKSIWDIIGSWSTLKLRGGNDFQEREYSRSKSEPYIMFGPNYESLWSEWGVNYSQLSKGGATWFKLYPTNWFDNGHRSVDLGNKGPFLLSIAAWLVRSQLYLRIRGLLQYNSNFAKYKTYPKTNTAWNPYRMLSFVLQSNRLFSSKLYD